MECAALNRLATLAVHERFDFEQAKALLQQALRDSTSDGITE